MKDSLFSAGCFRHLFSKLSKKKKISPGVSREVGRSSILSVEKYPIAFDALIMRIKDPITLTTTVDTLNYDDASAQAQSIPAAMRAQIKEKQDK
jgi:hypothetical protein